MKKRSGAGGAVEPPAAPRGPNSSRHDEWLLDEALGETFPASDPIAPALPRERTDESERGSPHDEPRSVESASGS